jgi:hypothetical protein
VKAAPADIDVDTCLLVSLFHGDSGYAAAEAWLAGAKGEVIRVTQELFCRERLWMLEPRG